MGIELSIVVCTLNRADLLDTLLKGIACQRSVDASSYELLVVDNGSTDPTCETVTRYISKFVSLRYIFEPNIGLSNARNRGWQEARGEYIAYVDDDCRIPADWLPKVLTITSEKSPLAFGGPYMPFYLSPKPEWYKDTYGTFKKGNYSIVAGPANGFNLSGGNFVVQRRILDELGGFDLRLGMAGTTIAYAEEDELQNRIRQHWGEDAIYFDPQLVVHHLVAERKMHIAWRIRQQYALGKSLALLRGSKTSHLSLLKRQIRLIKTIAIIVASLLQGFFLRDRCQYPHYHNWVYEVTALYFTNLGTMAVM